MTSQGGTTPANRAPRPVSWRTLAAGAAWSVPVIAVGAAAPAMAASICGPLPAFAAPAWTITTSGSSVTGTGAASFGGGNFEQTHDASRGSTFVATASSSLAVVAGVVYTFVLSFRAYVTNTQPMRTYLDVGGSPLTGLPLVDTSLLAVNSGSTYHVSSRTAAYVATSTGTVAVAVRTSISTPVGGVTSGDDMLVHPLVLTCA
ncbi:hypothetical protein [Phycicoccus sonneratiae]|uniref:Uncharacterized protein n=1 Tax=Phycicoccus sonneratiae TaxID=2807628 RepID=A0ABS2CMF2_9MICO|nr:hypothetical protein [Phycicoccus sonneraticus]MBM6401057.1 hypothetical protein [Phycicoccus sonneraticus]